MNPDDPDNKEDTTDSGESVLAPKLTTDEARSLIEDLSAYELCLDSYIPFSQREETPRTRTSKGNTGRQSATSSEAEVPSWGEVVFTCATTVCGSLNQRRGTIELLSNPQEVEPWLESHGIKDEKRSWRTGPAPTIWSHQGRLEGPVDTEEIRLSDLISVWARIWVYDNPSPETLAKVKAE